MSDILGMFKRVIGAPQDDADYEYDERPYEDDRYNGYNDNRYQPFTPYEERVKSNYGISERGKVVDMPTELNGMKVAVKKPAKYDDARIVCDKLKAFAPVVVNLERLDKDEAQRVVDFIMGACYTMDGHVEEIKEDVFLVAPSMVNIEKELADDKDVKANSFFSRFSF